MTLVLQIAVVIMLLVFSAICSGLNISLMSLGVADLKRQAKLGSITAIRVLPLRINSNLSLASIILSNVAVISAISLVIDHFISGQSHIWSGIVAGLLSTILIVLFGEIFPQALFSRHALSFTSRFSGLLKLMIVTTYPLSKPLQLLLDRLFGDETTRLHSRRELGILIGEHFDNNQSELDEDEVEIMQGALALSEKTVREITTKVSQVYWIEPDTMIDDKKIDEIKQVGRSRIPVFDHSLTRCYGVLLMKDLVDLDFDRNPQPVSELVLHPTKVIGSKTALDTLFRKFIISGTHLLPVERDDKIIGIVTIEDLLEEIVGHEIVDETDHRTKRQ